MHLIYFPLESGDDFFFFRSPLFIHEHKSIILTEGCQVPTINSQIMVSPVFLLLLIVCFLWLIGLTFLFVKFYLYYNNLSKDAEKESILDLLNDIFVKNKELNKEIEGLRKNIEKFADEGRLHIQKIGLLRFNPFNDTGGDQSFILSLLDDKGTGVVISSLHSRTGTRWYAKRVVKGRGAEYELSEDEQKAVKEVLRID